MTTDTTEQTFEVTIVQAIDDDTPSMTDDDLEQCLRHGIWRISTFGETIVSLEVRKQG